MTYTSKTNSFFNTKIYDNLGKFAFSPVSWAFEMKCAGNVMIPFPDFGKLLLAALLAPILVPTTIVTTAIALCLAAISAVVHGLSLLVSGILDAASSLTPAF